MVTAVVGEHFCLRGGVVRWAELGPDPTRSTVPAGAQGPTVMRIALGLQLRRLREASGITTEAAGYAIRASCSKISRMELGRVGFKERDVADLLTLYGVTEEPERQAFLAMARRANEPGWWQRYSDVVPSWFETYLGLEQASSVIRPYQPQLLPGLLQTEQVARAVLQLTNPAAVASDDELERRVALRMARQDLLAHSGAPDFRAVIDESALWRLNGRSVMRAQIEHLIRMAELPNVAIQVIPIYSGAHAAVGGPFTILEFREPDLPTIVYLEQLTSALYLDKVEDVQHYIRVLDHLVVQAKTPTDTITFFWAALKEI
jgi:transcriptional regulator with XRE-family HTH domain